MTELHAPADPLPPGFTVPPPSPPLPGSTLTPERWQRIKLALDALLPLPPEVRQTHLEQLARSDAALCTELRSLLSAMDEVPSSFLDAPVASLGRPAGDGGFAGQRFGPYQLVERIGVGGMGEVYRAVRVDDEYRHEVAIKLVGTDQGQLVGRRLRAERQILAGLEHPNIARLLDGGTSAQGVPYLVMELIAGVPITEYCNQHRLDVSARLKLFQQVCAAVQHAHRHMIVHRDLKPRNILVTPDGVPKLLDFGIAKILEPGDSMPAADATLTCLRMLTPQYASPEQLRGEPVTTSTDIYSLGVILYELLTGLRPFSLEGGKTSLPALLDTEARRPSTMAPRATTAGTGSPRRLRRQLRGDLDNITLMALAKQPERRYGTVEQLAEDIRRHLQRLPVHARRSTPGYRLAMFLARHRIGVVAASFMGLALLAGVIITSREARVAQHALTLAREESHAADQVTTYLESLFEAVSPERTGGKAVDPRVLVDSGQARLAAYAAERPVLRARMLGAMGALYCKIGQSEQCRSDLQEALTLLKGSTGSDPLMIARLEYQLGAAYNAAGRTDEALRLLEHAVGVLEVTQPVDRHQLAAASHEVGYAYILRSEEHRAIVHLTRARTLLADAQGDDTPDSARTLGALAIAYAYDGQPEKALQLAAHRLSLAERSFGRDDVRYFNALNDSAEVALRAGRFADAERDWRQVTEGYARFYAPDSDQRIDAGLSLADVLFRRNKLRESIQSFQQAVKEYERQGERHRDSRVGALSGLSQVLTEYGDYKAAEAAAYEAYLVARDFPLQSSQRAEGRHRWAYSLIHVGRTEQALPMLQADLPADGAVRLTVAQRAWVLWLADCYRMMGQAQAAEKAYDRAIRVYESNAKTGTLLGRAYEGKGLLMAQSGRQAQAVPLLRKALELYGRGLYVPDGPAIAAAKVELAASLLALKETAEARALLAVAGPLVERELAPTHPARRLLVQLRTEGRAPGQQSSR